MPIFIDVRKPPAVEMIFKDCSWMPKVEVNDSENRVKITGTLFQLTELFEQIKETVRLEDQQQINDLKARQ